jgi:L-2,4-diaminobutyric acid acetyltransferase
MSGVASPLTPEIMSFDTTSTAKPRVSLRPPQPSDTGQLWQLARESGGLEANSSYTYALLCAHFPDTCIVADDGAALAGFVVGYRLPRSADTLFVWQVTVAPSQRGRGLGIQLLAGLLDREALADVRYLEATVTPSNQVSQRLFRGIARRLGAHCQVRPFFAADLFAEAGHEAEDLYRIGPFPNGPLRAR